MVVEGWGDEREVIPRPRLGTFSGTLNPIKRRASTWAGEVADATRGLAVGGPVEVEAEGQTEVEAEGQTEVAAVVDGVGALVRGPGRSARSMWTTALPG